MREAIGPARRQARPMRHRPHIPIAVLNRLGRNKQDRNSRLQVLAVEERSAEAPGAGAGRDARASRPRSEVALRPDYTLSDDR